MVYYRKFVIYIYFPDYVKINFDLNFPLCRFIVITIVKPWGCGKPYRVRGNYKSLI